MADKSARLGAVRSLGLYIRFCETNPNYFRTVYDVSFLFTEAYVSCSGVCIWVRSGKNEPILGVFGVGLVAAEADSDGKRTRIRLVAKAGKEARLLADRFLVEPETLQFGLHKLITAIRTDAMRELRLGVVRNIGGHLLPVVF